MEPRDQITAILKLKEFILAKPTSEMETMESQRQLPNNYNQFIENQVLQLQRDIEWKGKKLAGRSLISHLEIRVSGQVRMFFKLCQIKSI
jgi:hypothetical protein